MPNKNISQYNLDTTVQTGDYLLLWSVVDGITYRVYAQDVAALVVAAPNQNNHFTDILVDRYAFISGVIGGNTGSHIFNSKYGGILAGSRNSLSGSGNAIIAGTRNLITSSASNSTICGGQINEITARDSVIVGGDSNLISQFFSAVLVGNNNYVGGQFGVIAGGDTNNITGGTLNYSFIGNGKNHFSYVPFSFIGNGNSNIIYQSVTNSGFNTILNGENQRINSDYSFIGGGNSNLISGDFSAVCAGSNNVNSGSQNFIGAGQSNTTRGVKSAVVCGSSNKSTGDGSFVGAGTNNLAGEIYSTVVCGSTNTVKTQHSFIGAGESNTIFLSTNGLGDSSIVGGGGNHINADYASILGGSTNKVSGIYGTVLGGLSNVSSGQYTLTFGQKCEAFQNGAVLFGDSTNAVKRSYGQDSFTLNYSGGHWITGGGLNVRRGFNLYPTGDAPISSTPGRSGDFAYKDDFLYIKSGQNDGEWGRVQLSTLNSTPPSVTANISSITYGGTGNSFEVSNSYAAGAVQFVGPGSIGTIPLSLTIPAGAGTYMIDCNFGIYKGSVRDSFYYMLYNTTNSRMVPNASGGYVAIWDANGKSEQLSIKIITGIHSSEQASSKTIQLYAHVSDGSADTTFIISTGAMISYVKLA